MYPLILYVHYQQRVRLAILCCLSLAVEGSTWVIKMSKTLLEWAASHLHRGLATCYSLGDPYDAVWGVPDHCKQGILTHRFTHVC